MSMPRNSAIFSAVLAVVAVSAQASPDGPALYREHCAACHGVDRLGGTGPALLPENLGRLKPEAAAKIIAAGRPASQMAGFADRLGQDDIAALAKLIYAPIPVPEWGEKEITASRIVHTELAALPRRPVHAADPLNLFTVVEIGDHHVTILDGDRFEPIWRFPSRFALHGGAKYSPDGRFVYLASRDGWVAKYDLYGLVPVAEARVAVNTRNIAVSSDGRYLIAGNGLPPTLAILDAEDFTVLKVIAVKGDKDAVSRISAVYDAAPRQSFIVALRDIPEIWEVPYADNTLSIRRIRLEESIDDFFFDPPYAHLIGASRDGGRGQVIDLDAGRKIADVALPGMPHLGSGISFAHEGRPVLATPHLKEGAVSIVDMTNWQTIKRIATAGPGFFMRSHENTPYAWTDSFLSPAKDKLQVIDKRTLEIVRTVVPAPGRTAAHVEFTRDGRYVLASVWEDDGALVVYDAATFAEVKRLPMKKPSGKYNVHNKITRSAGTSH